MLILSRKKNESICIGDDVTVVVVEIRGDKTRLGIQAPSEMPVHRKEVYDAIHNSPGDAPVLGMASRTTVIAYPSPDGRPILEFIESQERPYRIRRHWLSREELVYLHASIGAALERDAA